MTVSRILGCESATNTRPRDEFYETPKECVQALIKAEEHALPEHLWEPFCGDGAISRVLKENKYIVEETDLNPRAVGTHRIDFLMERKSLADGIVSNPPFNLAHDIIRHAIDVLNIDYMALLLKADFLNSGKGLALFNRFQPYAVHALSWRPDFKNQGSPTMNCSWFIWRPKTSIFYGTTFQVLPKP